MSKRILLFLVFSICIINIILTQDIAFKKSNFPEDIEEFKEAKKHLIDGYNLYENDKFQEALIPLNKAFEFNPNSLELLLKLSVCYYQISSYKKSIEFVEKTLKIENQIDGYYFYLSAMSHQFLNEFDQAKELYLRANKAPFNIKPDLSEVILKRMVECESGVKLKLAPRQVKIEVLSNMINTKNEEYVPLINADESILIFTSRRPENIGGNKDESINDFYEDIYISSFDGIAWSKAENLGKPINTERHDATVGLSVDGQSLFIYRDNKKGDGNIYISNLKGGEWTNPLELPEPINSKYQETSACFSPDGNSIYFVSDRPEGMGGKDIYFAEKSKEGKWQKAEILNQLNSPLNEDGVFMHPDGKTLYFSSEGFNSIGGYDVFSSQLENGRWSKPKNIGFPINSAFDDVSIVLSASGEHAYFTSNRSNDDMKRDIYKITFLDREQDESQLTLLKGIVTDSKTGEILEAEIELLDMNQGVSLAIFKSNALTGKFMVSIPAGSHYRLYVMKEGYLFHTETMEIDSTQLYKEIDKAVKLDPVSAGVKIVLNNVFYDYNESKLQSKSYHELNMVVKVLDDNPDMIIEIGSHTDSRGSSNYNQVLSEKRAQSCVDYLILKGVKKERLMAKGYGELKPVISPIEIESLKTDIEIEKAHQQNRRTEFTILKN